MRKKTIMFRKIDDMLDFINKVENYPYDAKSLFGILNLGLEKKIELKVYDENCDALFEDIAPYVTA